MMLIKSMRRGLFFSVGILWIAQPASAIGLMQAYTAALQNDPQYRSAVFDNQAGQEYKNLGLSALLPSAQFNYGSSKNKAETTQPFNGRSVTTRPEYTSINSGVTIRQTLFNLDATARYKQGIAQADHSEAVFSIRAQDLMVRVVNAYADAKYGEDQFNLIKAQRDSYAEQKRINDRMFEKGEGTITEMLETQAKLDVAEAQLIESADNLTLSRNTLAEMIGQDVNNLDGLANDFQPAPLAPASIEEWRTIANEKNAEILAGRISLESAEYEVSRNKAGHAPRLDLTAGYNRSISDSLTTFNQDSTVRSIGVQLTIPLYSGGYVNSSVRQAVANREKARSDLNATTSRVIIELRKQFSTVQSSVAKILALQKSVKSSTSLVEATQQSVKGGVRINVDVLNAQQQLVLAKRDLAQARYNYLISMIKLRVAAGTLNIDDLQTVASYFSPAN